MSALSPIVSEHESDEAAARYDRWFREKVRASREDGRPSIPHDAVMAEMDEIIRVAEERMAKRNSTLSE
ncbi:stability determinant [Azospirillum sp. B4]|uniref:type II toxin-antitoxin system RelB family antitoxin n=1 Tax=Azospirillum sp. B4 TaxID=95605 RepID=UPI00034B5553|nr:stability determinant [Azospirillum sp. B4]